MKNNSHEFLKLDYLLRKSIAYSSIRLSISMLMAEKYRERYGGSWFSVANAIDDSIHSATLSRLTSSNYKPTLPFKICYMGGLAPDMSSESVLKIARALSHVKSSGIDVELHVYTMPWYKQWASDKLISYDFVSIFDFVHPDQYMSTLSSYHASIVAYNFDEVTALYTSLSMANKLPEILASGALLFAFGPATHATIAYISQNDLGIVVTIDSNDVLVAEFKRVVYGLMDGSLLDKQLSAIRFSRARHSLRLLHSKMSRYLGLACKSAI